MTRYPRPFKYRRMTAAPPDLRPRKFSFEIDPVRFHPGSNPEWERCCNVIGINTTASPRVLQDPKFREILRGIGITQFKIFADIGSGVTVEFTKRPRISPKLLATFPRLIIEK